MLNEIEKNIDRYLQEFKQSEDIDQPKVLEEQKKIKQAKRSEYRLNQAAAEEALVREKLINRQKEKEGKKFVKTGKPDMARSKKPAVKKMEKKEAEQTEEQKDKIKYLELF